MLAIQHSDAPTCTPNLLPLRINHNGRINATQRYWTPAPDEKGIQHVHFRGRHLHGTVVRLPEQYIGAVLNVTEKHMPQTQTQIQTDALLQEGEEEADADVEHGDMALEQDVQVNIAEQVGEFDEFVVWGHGGQVEVGQDVFVRGVREWIAWAESMHVDGDGDGEGEVEQEEKGEETQGEGK